jgi:hypothetical protein
LLLAEGDNAPGTTKTKKRTNNPGISPVGIYMRTFFQHTSQRFGRSRGAFVLIAIFLSFQCEISFPQSPYTSIGSGFWNNDAVWSGAGFPNGAGDDATVSVGHTLEIRANSYSCKNLTINGTITFNSGNAYCEWHFKRKRYYIVPQCK